MKIGDLIKPTHLMSRTIYRDCDDDISVYIKKLNENDVILLIKKQKADISQQKKFIDKAFWGLTKYGYTKVYDFVGEINYKIINL